MQAKLLLVFGTRPEAIKMAPLVSALAKTPGFSVRTCVTGQHRELLTPVLRLFDLKPEIDLDLMRAGQDLSDLTAAVLVGVRDALRTDRPDCVLVHGDTTTTLAASLAGFHERIPVAHVEAGLRTGDLAAPFPEEMNRQVTARLARWHFAPTAGARDNLLREGVPPHSVTVTGNTVVDAMQAIRTRFADDATLRTHARDTLTAALGFDPASRPVVLVTGHRRENFGAGLQALCGVRLDLASQRVAYTALPAATLHAGGHRKLRRNAAGHRTSRARLD